MKTKTWLSIIVLSLFLSGCWNLYAGQRPVDLGPAIWRSEDPDIWFEVFDEDPEDGYVDPVGQLVYKGMEYSFWVMFDNANGIVMQRLDSGDTLLMGDCKFGSDRLIVKILPKGDFIFNGTIKEITFIKYEKDKR